ncbi:mutator type transposase [Tanacetum coccineum]
MVVPLYHIRDNGVHDRDPYKMYKPHSTLFSIKLYYGGVFTISPNRKYNNGCDLDNGLEPLACDKDVVILGNYVTQVLKLVKVFIEHEKTNPDIYTPPKPKKLVIEELDDAEPIISKAGITLVAKKLVLDVNNNQTYGKEKGKSSGKDFEGQSSAVGNDDSSQVPKLTLPTDKNREGNTSENVDLVDTINNVETEGDEERQGEEETEVDEERQGEKETEVGEERQGEKETKVEDESDSEDSDYLVDEDNNVDDVDVDMKDFEYNIDEEVEFVGCKDREQPPDIEEGDAEEIEVLDNDYFESASDSDDEGSRLRKRKLKQIRKQAHASEQIYKTHFYVGKEFPNKEEVKEYIKVHSIKTMREIRLEKNDNERVRAIYKGVIPSLPTFEDLAVSVDPNNGIYPLAYGLVETENTESWTWFLTKLGDDLDLYRNSNFNFINDRQKGIILAIVNLFPNAEHRYCVKHIHENMKKKWNGTTYKELMWRAAKSTTVPDFQLTMEALKEFSNEAYEWLNLIPPQHWSRSHFSAVGAKSDVLLINMCEIYNGKLVAGRDRPIISTLEFAREYLMKRYYIMLIVTPPN